jgi:GDPmannose 4,6-dehydratase
MLQQDEAQDYVIGTGESHTVQEFAEEAFSYVNLDWKEYVEIDPKYFRPTEVDHLQADISKAKKKLGWEPKVKFHELVKIMIDADLELIGLNPIGQGKQILKSKDIDWTANKLTIG